MTATTAEVIDIKATQTIKTATGHSLEFSGGGVALDNGVDLTIDGGGTVTMTAITANSAENVDISGTTVTTAAIGDGNEIHTVKLTGTTAVRLGGDIVTGNTALNNVDINGPVILLEIEVIDTSAESGLIDFDGKIDSFFNCCTYNLTLKAKGGAISVGGIIGSTDNIGNLNINKDYDDGIGKITLSGVGAADKIGITGTVDVGHTGTASMDLAGSYYNIDGNTILYDYRFC